MRRFLLLIISAFLLTVSAGSQTLNDNEAYQQMLEFERLSEEAYEAGDYNEAKRLAVESQTLKEESDAWIENEGLIYQSRSALDFLENRLAEAVKLGAEKNFPEEYAEGVVLYEQAYKEYHSDEDYEASQETARRGIEILSVIQFVRNTSDLPAKYTVRLLPGNTDCLWNISGYEFIYDNPWEWRTIYNANKDIMPERDNPNLIHPGMVLDIPSLEGEERGGNWVDGEIE